MFYVFIIKNIFLPLDLFAVYQYFIVSTVFKTRASQVYEVNYSSES